MSLRVGFFPQNNSLWVLRHRGILERSVGDVEWVNLRELPGGGRVDPKRALPSQHGDHLFDGGYDFIGTGSTPPVTAQAKGHDVVYVAVSGPRYENGRLVVRDESPIRDVADLAGKRIALGQPQGAHPAGVRPAALHMDVLSSRGPADRQGLFGPVGRDALVLVLLAVPCFGSRRR